MSSGREREVSNSDGYEIPACCVLWSRGLCLSLVNASCHTPVWTCDSEVVDACLRLFYFERILPHVSRLVLIIVSLMSPW